MKVALIQMGAGPQKLKNIQRACALIRQAIQKKAEFILLPEMFPFRGQPKDAWTNAEHIPGSSIKPLMELARAHRVFILAGSVGERIKGTKKIYSTSVLINPKGKIVAKYRKIHLFDARLGKKVIQELRVLKAGKTPVLGCVENFKVGLSICYDLRFPVLYKEYAQKGADILCAPSCFTKKTGQAHWEVLCRARAIENLCYVLAPDQIGKDARGVASFGNSMIVDPWGEVLQKASLNKNEIIYADLTKTNLTQARKRLPAIH
ncbi:MAG: carbon-nitrogen hydrolase family protein [Candidatus Omnitrophota bacterium]